MSDTSTRTIVLVSLLSLVGCVETPAAPAPSPSKAPWPRTSSPMILDGSAYDAAGLVELPPSEPGEAPGLHNVFELSEDIISGGEPASPEALETIASWGVRTILSVDGKAPDAETAAALGMRYVHVPIEYGGITDEAVLKIAKTFRELEGPFYVHCFHGKHRGPAAAAIGRIVLDDVPRERAIAEMRQWCATSSKYEGLYAAVATARIPADDETAVYPFDFESAHSFDGMRAAMIEATRKWDLVTAADKRDWAPDPDHPDVDVVREAEQLHRIFDACASLDEIGAWPDDFRAWMEDARLGAEQLAESLAAMGGDPSSASVTQFEAIDTAFARVRSSCSSCHDAYRN